MKRRALIIMLVLSLLVSGSGIVAMAESNYVAIIDGIGYSTLNDVQQAIDNGNQATIELRQDIGELKVNGREVFVDLNGHDIENVTVTNNGTFYGSDSQTNDFESESKDDYGIIGNFTGNVQAAFSPEKCGGYGCLMFTDTENTNASFHYVRLEITGMVLRPQEEVGSEEDPTPSLYYQCDFKGDEVVADNVEKFGVALSLVGEPASIDLAQCGYSEFVGFEAGPNGNPDRNTGTLLYGIMKPTNATSINKRNADQLVYGQAYLKLTNETYVFGNAEERSFKDQVKLTNKIWTTLDSDKKAGFRTMYNEYKTIMQPWNLTGVTTKYANVVEDAVTWYKEFQNLPVAKPNMSTDELRKISKDFFRLQLSFKWTPNTTFMYRDFEGDDTTLEPNVVYKGLPYCMTSATELINGEPQEKNTSIGKSGSIYKAMNFYDPATGVLDLTKIFSEGEREKSCKIASGYENVKIGGAQAVYDVLTSNCGNGLSWGWNRVSNSTKIHNGSDYTPVNGALPVGPYKWNEAKYSTVTTETNSDGTLAWDIDNTDTKTIAAKIIADNDDQVMYQSYAAMQIGDGLYSGGHLMMCSVKPVIVTVDGKIDPDKSYLYRIDQNSNGSTDRWERNDTYGQLWRKQGNGFTERDLGGFMDDTKLGTRVTFRKLLEDNYLPITIPEFVTRERIEKVRDQSMQYFADTDIWNTYYAPRYLELIEKRGIEKPDAKFAGDDCYTSNITPNHLTTGLNGSISANYVISNVRIILQDSKDKVLREEYPIIHTNDTDYSIKFNNAGATEVDKLKGTVVYSSELLTKDVLDDYAGKGNRIIIEVQLSTGDWDEVMNAKLIAG